MLKKLTLLAVSVASLIALAAPAAQAEGPLITDENGNAPTYITTKSTDTVIVHTATDALECKTTSLIINFTQNAKTTVKGYGSGTAEGTPKGPVTHSGHCGFGGAVGEVTSLIINDLHLTKHGAETTGTASLSFTYDLRSATGAGLVAECTFSGTVPVAKTGTDILNVAGNITKTAGSAFCPATSTITIGLTLLDEFGSPVAIH